MLSGIADRAARRRGALLEAFVLANFAFLVLDVFLAHAVNDFRHRAEWLPFYFSIAAALLLASALPGRRTVRGSWACRVGLAVGGGSIALGVAGVAWHLESQFFSQWTVRSLVYTAPFAAPLAYSGLGFLLLVNRVAFFAWGGFVGVFVLALCDHAQNGFFHVGEWWPVAASALAVGFLGVALADRRPAFLGVCLGVLALQAAVGLIGFWFHLAADVNGLSASLYENFVHGAPVFAPLLFVDLAALAAIGMTAPPGEGARQKNEGLSFGGVEPGGIVRDLTARRAVGEGRRSRCCPRHGSVRWNGGARRC